MMSNNVCRGRALRIAIGITVLTFLLTTGVLANPVLVDNFSDNAINTSIWAGLAHGYGPTYAETNQSLEINIPSNSAVDPSAEFFGAGYRSVCSLRGDFDIQTDYKLLTWPYANGVRVILGAVMLADPPWTPNPYTFGDAQRTSFGPTNYDFIGYPREVYIAYSSDVWTGNFYAPTLDQSGKLRLVRSGSTLTSYYYNQNNWVVIHSALVNTSDANFTINAMSNNYFFTNQEVKVAFDNFTINQGQLICSAEDTIPPTTAISLSGTLGNNSWYTSDVQVTLTATDSEGGSSVNKTEYSFDNTTWNTYTAPFDITNEGTTTLYYYSTDNAGNFEATKNQMIKIDKIPPQITINIPANGSAYNLNQTVFANWSASDSISGIASATGTTPSGVAIDTASIGTKMFSVNAEDNAGNTMTKTATYYIYYNYSGILHPINADGSSIFKLGSTISVKFQLQDANGNFITNAVAKIYTAKISDGVPGTEIEANSTSNATTGNLFGYDSTSNQYIFNLGTKTLSSGTWQIRIELDDGTSKYVTISLR